MSYTENPIFVKVIEGADKGNFGIAVYTDPSTVVVFFPNVDLGSYIGTYNIDNVTLLTPSEIQSLLVYMTRLKNPPPPVAPA